MLTEELQQMIGLTDRKVDEENIITLD